MLEWRMFKTPLIEPEIVAQIGEFTIKKFSSAYPEFCLIRLEGELFGEQRLLINEFGVILNMGEDVSIAYKKEEKEGVFTLAGLSTALIEQGCVVSLIPRVYDCCICIENVEHPVQVVQQA